MYQSLSGLDYYDRSATRQPHQPQLAQSFLGFDFPVKTGYRASYVHIVIRIAFDRRLPLYARKTQTQCLRHQPMAYTPITRAV